MMTITPISDRLFKNSVGWMMFSTAGPKISPASRAPTTWGSCSFWVISPSTLVLKRMSATSNKNLYDSMFSSPLCRFPPALLLLYQPSR